VVKTIKEFKEELKLIREDLYRSGEFADPKLIASWLDRLLVSLEEISPKLDLMMIEIEQLSNATPSPPVKKTKKKSGKKPKKAAKKVKKPKAKKSKKRKR